MLERCRLLPRMQTVCTREQHQGMRGGSASGRTRNRCNRWVGVAHRHPLEHTGGYLTQNRGLPNPKPYTLSTCAGAGAAGGGAPLPWAFAGGGAWAEALPAVGAGLLARVRRRASDFGGSGVAG